MSIDRFHNLLAFLQRLDHAKIHYSLGRYRDDAVSVHVVIPGERWEIDFLDDGDVDVERFVSDGEIFDSSALEELFIHEDHVNDSPATAVPHEDSVTRT